MNQIWISLPEISVVPLVCSPSGTVALPVGNISEIKNILSLSSLTISSTCFYLSRNITKVRFSHSVAIQVQFFFYSYIVL